MLNFSARNFAPLLLATLALAACDKSPAGLRTDPGVTGTSAALAADGGSIPQAVIDHGKLVPHTLIPGYPDLSQACTSGNGLTVTGIAFDGTNIYVGHGGFVNSCITRYNAATGAYIDQKVFRPDVRGLHWVPGLGKLVARTYGGSAGNQDNPAEIGRFFTIDYPAGTSALLTNYDVQTCDPQGQPGVDPDGLGYWINCSTALEHHRMSDGLLLSTRVVAPFWPNEFPVWAGPDVVVVPSGAANQYAVYDRITGTFQGNVNTVSNNGCFGYGVGAMESGTGAIIGINLDCSNVRIETIGGNSHGPLTAYPGTVFTSHVTLCKDASSPAGSYNFTISAVGTVAGDVVQSAAQLSPGQCRIVFSRTAFSLAFATLTITEQPSNTTVVHTITKRTLTGTTVLNGPNPTTMTSVNSDHGTVVTYKNIAGTPPIG